MKIINQYLARNKQKIKNHFKSLSTQQQLPATKLFVFLQHIFNIQPILLTKGGKQYFKDQTNQQNTARMIQQYYRSTPQGKKGKFYLYRINFTYEQIQEYVSYWINNDSTIQIYDHKFINSEQVTQKNQQPQINQPFQNSNKEQNKQVILEKDKQNNLIQQDNINNQQRILQIQNEIKKLQQQQLRIGNDNQQSPSSIQNKINQLKQQLTLLKQQNQHQNNQQKNIKSQPNFSSHKSKTQLSRPKKQINFKSLFQFYAKQNHLTGVKASFQRIQHESQTINYQKLVHFLKQYDIFPQKPKQQKKLHNIYVRTCSNTRDLYYEEFMIFLQKLPQILYQKQKYSEEQKRQRLMKKIQEKQQKNKLLHNPFHSLQKHNFRTDPSHLKYQFKLKPLKGKFQQQITNDLQLRKKQKSQRKQQLYKQKQIMHLKRLKKLMSIDPFHPQVIKNASILQPRDYSLIEPVVNLQNMQKFRDDKFDMKAHFGIVDLEQHPLKAIHSQRYESNKRAQQLQKMQTQKMSILMSGIIQRSQAKMMKLGLSPKKQNSRIN